MTPRPPDPLQTHADRLRAALPTPDDIYRRAASRRRVKALAGILALSCGLAGIVWWDPVYQSSQVDTQIGERMRWTLSDGSQVSLNTGSRLDIRYRLRTREFVLHDGEAHFLVAPSPLRRFVVHTAHGQIEDLGTAFNVRTTPESTRVDVLEGRVRVSSGEAPAQDLRAGEATALIPGAIRAPAAASWGVDAWRQGRVVFDRTPLADVVSELQRYRTSPLVLRATALADLPISGQFDIARLDLLPEILATVAPVKVVTLPDGTMELRARAPASGTPPHLK